ncbi:hypothetical protein [Streptomyces sp. NPDC059455]|uniref:hypothetical protein n=1 Tax=Streptomyces sp. NPDC059455 TaxID=3346837 RepID=UPI0036BFA8CD
MTAQATADRRPLNSPQPWYLCCGAVLFLGAVALGGFTYYWFVQRARTGVLAEHAAATAP